MIERIYDALKAVISIEWPKNSMNQAVIYDRVIKNWYLGERSVVPDNITVLISGQQNDAETDNFYGYRQIQYDLNVKLYVSGDDQETSLRIAIEGARLLRMILNKHKRMWVMEKCFICNKLPTSPEHFFIDTDHQNVFGVYGSEAGPTGTAGGIYNDFRTNWYKTHPTSNTPGTVARVAILASGANYVTAPSVIISGGGFGASGATAVAVLDGSGRVNQITMSTNGFQYTAIPSVTLAGGGGNSARAQAIIAAPSTAGIAANSFNRVFNNFKQGIVPSTLTTQQVQRLNDLVRDNVFPVRVLFDVQVQSVAYTDEAVDKAFLNTCNVSLQAKELVPVQAFGPNFSGSAYNPQEAV